MKQDTAKLGRVIEIDEAQIKDHLTEVLRGSVEDAIKALLDAEADRLCNAARYERPPKHGGIHGQARVSARFKPSQVG